MLRFTQFAVDNLGDAAYCIEHDGSIIYVNAAATQMLGYSREEFLRMRIKELNPDVHAVEWSVTWEALRRERRRTIEVRHRTKDGRIIPVEVSANLLVFEGKEYSCAFARDITERKQLEQRLRQSEKMRAIGELAGGVAHDFNNQLTGVSGYADLLLLKHGNDPDVAHFIEQIQLGVRRASSLTQQLLTFSREENELSEVVALDAVIAETIGMLERSIDKKIGIVRQLSATSHAVFGDSSRLQSAMLNLALNARDAMPQGGQLRIATSNVTLDAEFCRRQALPIEPGEFVLVEVADDGEGMPREVLDRAFEPFFTTKPKGKGTGLGLATVYGAVRSHRGTINVYSEVGKGTVVRAYLPLYAGKPKPAVDALELPPLPPGLGVMVVEDEEPLRRVAELTLSRLGCKVVSFENGARAVEHYATAWEGIDLVLLDMCMPAMDGTQTFHALREINPRANVLLASGYSVAGDAQALLQSGARGFMQKPYRMATLVERIVELCAEMRGPASVVAGPVVAA
jgi:PAS domain S-box-containing protein